MGTCTQTFRTRFQVPAPLCGGCGSHLVLPALGAARPRWSWASGLEQGLPSEADRKSVPSWERAAAACTPPVVLPLPRSLAVGGGRGGGLGAPGTVPTWQAAGRPQDAASSPRRPGCASGCVLLGQPLTLSVLGLLLQGERRQCPPPAVTTRGQWATRSPEPGRA